MDNRYLKSNYCGSCHPIASSGRLADTSNIVFSDWGLSMFFSAGTEGLHQNFRIKEDWLRSDSKTLFESQDYSQILEWIESHEKEIEAQVETNAARWLESHRQDLPRFIF